MPRKSSPAISGNFTGKRDECVVSGSCGLLSRAIYYLHGITKRHEKTYPKDPYPSRIFVGFMVPIPSPQWDWFGFIPFFGHPNGCLGINPTILDGLFLPTKYVFFFQFPASSPSSPLLQKKSIPSGMSCWYLGSMDYHILNPRHNYMNH